MYQSSKLGSALVGLTIDGSPSGGLFSSRTLESQSDIINFDSSINLETRRARQIVVDIPEF